MVRSSNLAMALTPRALEAHSRSLRLFSWEGYRRSTNRFPLQSSAGCRPAICFAHTIAFSSVAGELSGVLEAVGTYGTQARYFATTLSECLFYLVGLVRCSNPGDRSNSLTSYAAS